MTLVLAIPMAIACIVYAKKILPKKFYRIPNDDGEIVEMPYREPDYENAFHMGDENMPGTFESFAPLFLPIILILINTVATAMGAKTGVWEVLIFLGQPIIAVGLGLLLAIFTLGRNLDRHTALTEMEKGMESAGIIMLVTGGGGALGQIIKDSGLGTIYGRGTGTDSDSDHCAAAYHFHFNAFYPGIRNCCYDNSSKYFCSDHCSSGRKSDTWRDRMLCWFPVLRIL